MQRIGLPFESEGIFLTNVVSHLAMIPAIRQLIARRWVFETIVTIFTIASSFSYHVTQAFGKKIFFLNELQWHWLDNVGAISSFGIIFTYFAGFRDPILDLYVKIGTVLLAVFIQVPHPWDITYTFSPILVFAAMPFLTLFARMYATPTHNPSSGAYQTLYQRYVVAMSIYNSRELAIGSILFFTSFFFFFLGLHEATDYYRVKHGLWHTFGGMSAYHLWRVVKYPVASETASAIAKVQERLHHTSPHGSSTLSAFVGGGNNGHEDMSDV